MMTDGVFFAPSLADAFTQAGLPYPDDADSGRITRFSTGKNKDKAGWLRKSPDGKWAVFGCWREGTTYVWQQRIDGAPMPTSDELKQAKAQAAQARKQAEAERAALHATTAKMLEAEYAGLPAATGENAYCIRKGITPPDGVRQGQRGQLNIGVYDGAGCLQSVQEIFPPDSNGKSFKKFATDAKMQGGRFVFGALADGEMMTLCEGFSTSASVFASGIGAVVNCFSGSNLAVVAADLRKRYPNSFIRVAGDLDAHGKGAEYGRAAVAAAMPNSGMVLPEFSDDRDRGDFNDLHQFAGLDAVRSQLEKSDRVGSDLSDSNDAGALTDLLQPPLMRFKLLSGADLCNAPPMRWMVRGVLPADGLTAGYGGSGSGKSFLFLNLGCAVAGGDYEWFGRRVTQCPVTYVCLEGEAGIGKRVKAWSLHHNKPVPDAMRFITQPFDLLSDDVPELANVVIAGGGAGGLVILDTLNRAAPGADENSSVDMGNLIAAAKRLQSLTGGLVLLVHHTGKDVTKGLRGHSSLYAALDGAIEVTATDTRKAWSVAKCKDDVTGEAHPFKLEIVPVGIDDDGDEITSCVTVPDDSGEAIKAKRITLGANQKIARDVLGEPLRKSPHTGKEGAPAGRPCIDYTEAVELVAERMPTDAKHRKSRAISAISGLVSKGYMGMKGDWLWDN